MSLLDRTKKLGAYGRVLLSTLFLLFLSISCEQIGKAKSSNIRSEVNNIESHGALIYPSNPIILTNNFNLSTVNFENLTPQFITENFFLTKKCGYTDSTGSYSSLNNCVEVKNDRGVASSTLLQRSGDSWQYDNDSDEFYQVNTFYHVNLIQERFSEALSFSRDQLHSGFSIERPVAAPFNLGANRNFWLSDNDSFEDTLQVYSRCFLDEINAFFDASTNEICLGWNEDEVKNFRISQDPSIIYHEMGHVFVKIMMNLRNQYTDGFILKKTPFQSDLGSLAYDEAGALNEGIADYFSYFINGRDRIGEWGIGRFFNADRPLSENNSLHQGKIPDRLRYPEFLHYIAQDPNNADEDIHNAGQIVSHYLVSLTESLKNKCSTMDGLSSSDSHKLAGQYIILLMSESLAEIGDMTAKGSDFLSQFSNFTNTGATSTAALMEIFFTNLNEDEAYLWSSQVTPPNFRKFFKVFAKNLKDQISNKICPEFTVDDSEILLDDYGLLLFKSYNDAGTGIDLANIANPVISYSNVDSSSLNNFPIFNAPNSSTSVNEANRNNSILISKTLLDLPTDRATGFVIDTQSSIRNFINSRTFEGKPLQLSDDIASTRFNNGNVKISPGEVVAISLNLLNSSNSTMGGVQILANDWDHMQLKDSSKSFVNRTENLLLHSSDIAQWQPCQIDGWPLETEGGAVFTPESTYAFQTAGGCNYPSRDNRVLDPLSVPEFPAVQTPRYEADAPQPVCLVQSSTDNETQWVSQDQHRKELILSDNECLNSVSTGGGVNSDFNPNECLIRFVPGANQSVLGKIDPQKTWTETISANRTNGESPKPLASAYLLMEVSKWIPPGTTFNCRLRARFTNCQDCYNENNTNEDYPDFEYTGHKPFKIINFSFTVID